ncbi:MAG: gliding motility-associated C-terminal domain-containing protein [Saprospiraceae bacterium]
MKYLHIAFFIVFAIFQGSSQCTGLSADAGPDLFTCDPTMPVQLMGSFNGSPMKTYWTPTNYLSDPNILDPIVNAPAGKYKYTLTVEAVSTTNLVSNGDFESGSGGFTHEYNYGSPGGPFSPGWLSVGTNPFLYNGGFANCGDHTTGSGNQLIVDGHTTPNSKVWCQNITVTAGRTYLFRFYVQTVFPVSPAVLSATANNVSFGTVTAGANCDWQMFEACFTATSSSVEMCIRETTGVSFGNDFAIDDIEMFEKCMDSDEVMVEVVDLKAKIDAPRLPKCASDIFDLNAIGSSAGPNVSYEWRSEGGKIISNIGLSAKGKGSGKYIIKVIYKNGNVLCEKEAEIDITASDDLEATLEVEGIANCNSDTIILRAKPTNGSGNFSFNWIPANKIHRGKMDSIAYVTDAGLYKVVIIDMDSGCEIEIQDVVVSDTSTPKIQLKGDTLISCLNKNASLIGGPFDTTKYNYQWLLPDLSIILNKDSIFTSAAGNYSLKVIDKANKCYSEKLLTIKIDTTKPILEIGMDATLDCIQPEVTINPSANNPNQTINYFWQLPSGNLPVESNLQIKKENKAGVVILNLVNIKNGCQVRDSLIITDIRKFPIAEAGIGDTLTCIVNDITLNGLGTQIDSAKYSWTTKTGNIISGNNTLNPKINALGWYYLLVEDTTNHCTNMDSVFIDQNKIIPKAILGPDKIFTCADTLLTIDGSLSSQDPQIKYKWSTLNGSISNGHGSPFIEIKSAGFYTLVVLDTINGCSDTTQITVHPDLNAPLATIANADTITCKNPTVTLKATASSPAGNPIQYTWTATNGQIIQNPNTLNPSVSEAGNYVLFVKDQMNGCSTTVLINVAIDTLKPIANAGLDEVWNCKSTQIILDGSASSGDPNLLYNWTTTNGMISGNNQLNKIIAMGPGTYFLRVTDPTNGCESFDQIEIQKDLTVPIAVINPADTLTCIKTNIFLDGKGSSNGNRFLYTWSTTNGQIQGATDQLNIQITKPGQYQLIVTDTINHCTDLKSVLVFEDKIKPIVDAGNPKELLCEILDLFLTGTSNTVNSNVTWFTNQGNIIGKSDSSQIKINKPGLYYFQVTNSFNGCTAIDSVFVTQRNNLIVEAGKTTELTCQVKDATLFGSILNAAGNETILWSTNQGNFIGNINTIQTKVNRPGVYYFQVTNPINGCNGIDSVLISENTNIPTGLTIDLKQAKCPGDLWEASLNNIMGGELPLQYFLNNNQVTGTNLSGRLAGVQTVTIIDKNGCVLNGSFTTIDPLPIDVQMTPLVRLQSGESYQLKPLYSIPDDSIAWTLWSPPDFLNCTDCPYPQINSITRETEYFLTYANHNGCIATARIKIEIIDRGVWTPNSFSPNGDNINDRFYPVVTEDSYNEIRTMKIFDRWGNQLFESNHFPPNDPSYGWNGITNNQHAAPGVYVYFIELEWKNGEIQKLFGDLNLIR